MKAAPWQLDQPALDAATRRSHPALTPQKSCENAVESLLAANDIGFVGPAMTEAAKVIVAIFVDMLEAPQVSTK